MGGSKYIDGGPVGEEDALHPMRRQEPKRRQFLCWVMVGFAEQNVVAERLGDRADASHQFREEGVGDVGDDDFDQSRRLHTQPLGDFDGAKPSCATASWTRALRGGLTKLVPLMTFETVAVDTRARRATSLIVRLGKVRLVIRNRERALNNYRPADSLAAFSTKIKLAASPPQSRLRHTLNRNRLCIRTCRRSRCRRPLSSRSRSELSCPTCRP